RHNMRAAERERIARRGCPLRKGAGLGMIGSGATTVLLARRIALEMNDLTVIAHSFGVATVLALNPTITVLMVPGAYHAGEGAIHGAEAVGFLDGYQADWAVLGASGMDAGGPSDALLEAGEVYRRMVARAERTMLVADSSKFGKRFPACWAGWSDISCVVTDAAPPDGLVPVDSPTQVFVA
ncbi:MAG: DeoR/GlpR transcriptional regulator, partial [Pseudomonadota bacterium]